jgi:hypothetical protein
VVWYKYIDLSEEELPNSSEFQATDPEAPGSIPGATTLSAK